MYCAVFVVVAVVNSHYMLMSSVYSVDVNHCVEETLLTFLLHVECRMFGFDVVQYFNKTEGFFLLDKAVQSVCHVCD